MKRLKFLLCILSLAMALGSCKEEQNNLDSRLNVLVETVNRDNKIAENLVIMVDASSDVEWSASMPETDNSWVTMVKSSGCGAGRIIFTLSGNDFTSVRSATISVEGKSKSDGQTFKAPGITVNQLGSAPSLLINPEGTTNISYDAVADYSVEVTANLEWGAVLDIISGDGSWITIKSPTSPIDGTSNIILAIDENKTEMAREANLIIADVSDASRKAELKIVQQRTPAKYNLTIEGMSGTLPLGDATLQVAPSSGTNKNMVCNVSELEGNTILNYEEELVAGNYTLVSVTPSSASAIELDARFIIGEQSKCIAIDKWYAAFESFGGGSEDHPIKLSLPKHLNGLATMVNGGNSYSGFYFLQTEDISLAEYSNWVGIGTPENKFAGVYNGDNKKIVGLNISAEAPSSVGNVTCGSALFRHVSGVDETKLAQIRNVIVEGSVQSTAGYASALVAYCGAYTKIENCMNYANVSSVQSAAGTANLAGMVQIAKGSMITINNCQNRGAITATTSTLTQTINNIAGIVASIDGVSEEDRAVVSNCANYAKIVYQGNAAGVMATTNGNVDVVRCANYGEIAKSGLAVVRVSGVAGSVSGSVLIEECFNLGKIDGYRHSGTVVGWCTGASSVKNCYNRGEIVCQGSSGNTGGVVGNINANTCVVKDCYNTGVFTPYNVSDNNYFAGIAGSGGSLTEGVTGCFYEQDKGMVGGLGRGAKSAAVDMELKAEKKSAEWFTSGLAIDGWMTSVWSFSAGAYPSLINNPERP